MEREVVYNCLNDVAFKRIFKDKEILAFYIKMITNIDLNPSDISEISNEIKTSFNLKGNRYDVSIGVDDKLFLDIEAQNGIDNNLHFTRRMIHYSSLLYSQIFTSGSKYKEDHKTIVIFLVDDKNNKGRTYEKIQFKNEYNDEYDMQVIYKINIPKYIKDFKPKDENDKILVEALSVLISTDFKKYVKSNNNVIRKVADEIMKLNSDDYARIEMELYKAQQLHDRLDREAAIKEAAEKAAKEATKETTEKVQIETIKSMNSNGIDIEKISTILKLDIEYVKEVLNK